jgi:hypothetical protein
LSGAALSELSRAVLERGAAFRFRAIRSAGDLRMVLNREAIASFSSAGHGAKNPCSRMRKHSTAVCASLRVSAAKKVNSAEQ